jgi:hypothetical protein
MKPFKQSLQTLLIILISVISTASVFANTDFLADVETQITPTSSSEKIMKLQELFSALELYQ